MDRYVRRSGYQCTDNLASEQMKQKMCWNVVRGGHMIFLKSGHGHVHEEEFILDSEKESKKSNFCSHLVS